MVTLVSNIKIADYTYTGVVDITLDSSIENLTDTAKITLPKNAQFENENISTLIKRDAPVIIVFGYEGFNAMKFAGYVRSLEAKVPLTVLVEDSMYMLKKNAITTNTKAGSLNAVLTELMPDVKIKTADITIGKLAIKDSTPAQILKHLKEKYGIYSYFRGDTLYSGLKYWGDGKMHEIDFNRDVVQNDLIFRDSEDIKYKINAVSIDDNNKKTTVTKGDADGELRTFYFYNLDSKELERRAEQELSNIKYTGFYGSFKVKGSFCISHGDTVKLNDDQYTDRNGTYIVKSVKTEFGFTGYSQTIEIDRLWE